MRAFRFALGVLAVVALPVHAANVITRTGTVTGFWMASSGQTEAYVSWNQGVGTAFSSVGASVTISSSDGASASASVWITNAVGGGATAGNIIAGPVTVSTISTTPVSVGVPFAGTVNLPQGATYFLVVGAASANFQLNFASAATETVSATPPVTSNSDGLGGPPASTPAYTATFSAPGSPVKGILFSVTGNPPADLSISKTGSATATAGTNIGYTTTVTNNGPGTAVGPTVSDTTPAGLTFVSASGGGCSAFPCTLASMASGASVIITSTYSIGPSVTGSVSNTATVSTTGAGATFDLTPANNSSTTSATVSASADLAITKTNPAITAGSPVSYTVTVTNNGPSTATGVSATDLLPAGLTFSSATPSQGSYNSSTGVWTIGTMNPSAVVTLVLNATASSSASGSISNTATVTATGSSDSNPANNTATSTATVGVNADVSVSKTGPASIGANVNMSYTITVTNAGPATATGVTMSDTLPGSVTFVSVSGATCTGTTTISCAVGTLAPSGSATITLTVHTPAAGITSISNTATVSATSGDSNSANNTSTFVTTFTGPTAIPTLSTGAFAGLGLLLAAAGALLARRQTA